MRDLCSDTLDLRVEARLEIFEAAIANRTGARWSSVLGVSDVLPSTMK
jgi:hypothetical protein